MQGFIFRTKSQSEQAFPFSSGNVLFSGHIFSMKCEHVFILRPEFCKQRPDNVKKQPHGFSVVRLLS